MTQRGKIVLALGAGVYLLAWILGSKALYPVAVGLVLVALVTWSWIRLARRPLHLLRLTRKHEHFEGDDVEVRVELQLGPGLVPPGTTVLQEQVTKLGVRETPLARHGSTLQATYVIPHVPRGRYAVEGARAVLADPFGLQREDVDLQAASTLLVYPRLVALERLFSESGATSPEGSRLLLRRPTGYELHSVREHQQGESLRRVHWRSTAKRARLMVKELEDAPRDEVAVVLDAGPGAAAGAAFDVQVRAAGSLLLAHTARNRQSVLLVNAAVQHLVRTSGPGDWGRALELLAAAEPDGQRPVEALLAYEGHVAVRALELAVVTAALPARLVDRLVQRVVTHRNVSLVYVDAASFAVGGGRTREPALLRLQAAGVPVAVVRKGDDLARVLGAPAAAEVAHG